MDRHFYPWRWLPLLAIAAAALPFPALTQPKPLLLTPFYRSTQLQGHLFGMGLTVIPDYLQAPDLAFPYIPRPGRATEIPFVDSFTINRVMGGYREDWLTKFHLLDKTLGRRSLDYVTRAADGTLHFRPDLIRARLQPYLAAGYAPSDITLALDNTPWDLATPDGEPPEEGAWGRKTPPGNLAEWAMVVGHFATDLKSYLGPAADQVGFETGVEYDERASFDGDAASFFRYYAATVQALHSVLPNARVSPGEFTALGTCAPRSATCVYDSRDFLAFTQRANIMPYYVPRSLHALVDRGNPLPSAVAQRFAASYDRLGGVVPEVHQFGLLFEPFGEADQGDPGPMQAAWEFESLVGMMQNGAPRRVFHWGGLISMGKLDFLNGSGFLRLVLDHYVGGTLVMLPAQDQPQAAYPAETMAVLLQTGAARALVFASFSPKPADGLHRVTAELPASMRLSGQGIRVVAYKASDNVYAAIRHDLQEDGNLKPDFLPCPLCLGLPLSMATDPMRARLMLTRNWRRYRLQMQAGLKWQPAGADIAVTRREVTATLEANEILVLDVR